MIPIYYIDDDDDGGSATTCYYDFQVKGHGMGVVCINEFNPSLKLSNGTTLRFWDTVTNFLKFFGCELVGEYLFK